MPIVMKIKCGIPYPPATPVPGVPAKVVVLTSSSYAGTFFKSSKPWNGMTMWQDGGGKRKLFANNGGYWMIGDPVANTGFIKTKLQHNKKMPYQMAEWEIFGYQSSREWAALDAVVTTHQTLTKAKLHPGNAIELRLLDIPFSGADSLDCTFGRKHGKLPRTQSDTAALQKITLRLGDGGFLKSASRSSTDVLKLGVFRDPIVRMVAAIDSQKVQCQGAVITSPEAYAELADRGTCSGFQRNAVTRSLAEAPPDSEITETVFEKARGALHSLDHAIILENLDQSFFMMMQDVKLSTYHQCWPKDPAKGLQSKEFVSIVNDENIFDVRLYEAVKELHTMKFEEVQQRAPYQKSACDRANKLCWHTDQVDQKVKTSDGESMAALLDSGSDKVLCASPCSWH
ncbi:hypothetical protein DIPPA_21204 [Diplonema papillatum]|nr:hypothetical protein DIPPA_21204 [Diplonema papillatum]